MTDDNIIRFPIARRLAEKHWGKSAGNYVRDLQRAKPCSEAMALNVTKHKFDRASQGRPFPLGAA